MPSEIVQKIAGGPDIAIPVWTADDYEGTAPYEFLYQHRNDKFLLQRLLRKVKKQAGAIGVKGFMAMWDSYCESAAAGQTEPREHHTAFEDAPLELSCGSYICDNSGVRMLDKYGYEVVVCRHPILPIKRFINADTGEESVELWYKKGNSERRITVTKAVTASSTQIIQLAAYGIMVNSDNAKLLTAYLQEVEQINYTDLPEQKSIGRLGWIANHGFSPYVDDLVFDGETNYQYLFSTIRTAGNREVWLDAARKVRAQKGLGRLMLAASFASVLLEPCGLLPFFVHAWGGTGTGKTVGIMLAASVWADPPVGAFITTFNATDVGLEMLASFLNSLPVCIDELQIQSSEGIKDFDRMVYKLTEGVGKIRGTKNGGVQRMNRWKTVFITSGEYPILNAKSGGGAANRVLQIEATEPIYTDLVWLANTLRENYGFAGREFVEALQQEDALLQANAIQKEYYRQLLQNDTTEKQALSASALLAADTLATDLIFKDGNGLSIEDIEAVLSKKEEVDQNARALEYIYDLVTRNPMHFKPNEYGDYKAEVWGKEDGDMIYFIPSVFDRELSSAGYNSVAFLSWARRKGVIECDKDKKRYTKMVRMNGTPKKMVCVHRNLGEEDFVEISDQTDLPF